MWHILVALWDVESSWTRDQTPVLCTGRRILNHWTARGVLNGSLKHLVLGRSSVGVFRLSWRLESHQDYLSVWLATTFIFVGFTLRQPPHRGGKRATSSSWVTSYHVATPEQGRSFPIAPAEILGLTHNCLACRAAILELTGHHGSSCPGLGPVPSPEPKGGIRPTCPLVGG